MLLSHKICLPANSEPVGLNSVSTKWATDKSNLCGPRWRALVLVGIIFRCLFSGCSVLGARFLISDFCLLVDCLLVFCVLCSVFCVLCSVFCFLFA